MLEVSKEFAMESTSTSQYSPPVDKLLTYGEGKLSSPDNWPNYLELGLGPEHIPDLIRMATDKELNEADTDSLEVWAPTHAWRALGQIQAQAAIEPLLTLFETLKNDDWVMSELPEVFGMIGPAALPALAAYLADISHSESARISVTSCFEIIGKRWLEARTACVDILSKQLELFAENDPGLNGFLILTLVELHAKEAAPVIERAYAANRVETILMGVWEDVQVELGLKSPEEVQQKRSERLIETSVPYTDHKMTDPYISSKVSHESKAVHKKTKSKMAQQSRKKNRKR
jgi:hypothetical protein